MNTTYRIGQGMIVISALSILSVSLMAFHNPQSVMDLVQVKLSNTDALSSIRGVYGGAGFAIFLLLIFGFRKDANKTLLFLGILWGLYALSRVITILSEGTLGSFGKQWLIIESLFCVISLSLFWLTRGKSNFA